MKKLKVTIREKEKKINSFNLNNFRDEVVNFMYKKTVAESSRNSLVFYLLLFFLTVKIEKKTLLEDLLENNIDKIKILNTKLSQYSKLEKGQYNEIVKDSELTEVFSYDVFFTLILAFKNYNEIIGEFKTYFDKNAVLLKEYKRLNDIYSKSLLEFFNVFEQNLIEDDRVGYTGDALDLSKSVYRTIKMRSSRRIDLTLHKYAEVKKITSQSPIEVEIIQCIDPEVVFNIWDAYNLGDYVKNVWKVANESATKQPILFTLALTVTGTWLTNGVNWIIWKTIDGIKNRKEKDVARRVFKDSLEENRKNEKDDPILNALVKSVMSSNEYLMNEIKILKAELKRIQKEKTVLVDQSKKIKELKDKIEKLENVEVEVIEITNKK